MLLVFHGSGQNAERIRTASGHGFDHLAAQHGVVVVYPNAYKGLWNDSRVAAKSAARRDGVDDVQFAGTIVESLRDSHGIDTERVYAAGYSNGGQFVFRLATQNPQPFAAMAAIGATWPTRENLLGPLPTAPIPMMLINGTADPIVPFNGGTISLFGFRPRGTAISAPDTARLFARVNGITTAPSITDPPHLATSGKTSVTRTTHEESGRPPVWEYTVHGGGHVIPNPDHRAARIMGPQHI